MERELPRGFVLSSNDGITESQGGKGVPFVVGRSYTYVPPVTRNDFVQYPLMLGRTRYHSTFPRFRLDADGSLTIWNPVGGPEVRAVDLEKCFAIEVWVREHIEFDPNAHMRRLWEVIVSITDNGNLVLCEETEIDYWRWDDGDKD
jgi:hypothetical protein